MLRFNLGVRLSRVTIKTNNNPSNKHNFHDYSSCFSHFKSACHNLSCAYIWKFSFYFVVVFSFSAKISFRNFVVSSWVEVQNWWSTSLACYIVLRLEPRQLQSTALEWSPSAPFFGISNLWSVLFRGKTSTFCQFRVQIWALLRV
jgi:hypothetical protein